MKTTLLAIACVVMCSEFSFAQIPLPYDGVDASEKPLISMRNSGTGPGLEGTSAQGPGIVARGARSSVGISGISGLLTGYPRGVGVHGASDSGHGVVGGTHHASVYSAGVRGIAQGTGIGVYATSTAGTAGKFAIETAGNNSTAISVSTVGNGTMIVAQNNPTTSRVVGIQSGITSSYQGQNVLGGSVSILGTIQGGANSIGVMGNNISGGTVGVGVMGYQNGSGVGIHGETVSGTGVYGRTTSATAVGKGVYGESPVGIGVHGNASGAAGSGIGVRGETISPTGVAIEAKYSGAGVGTALEIENGALKVAGTHRPAFVHTATAANKLTPNGTEIDHPLCNGDPMAILFITQRVAATLVYNNNPVGVRYNIQRGKWEIVNESPTTAIPTNAQFNVLVIKQ